MGRSARFLIEFVVTAALLGAVLAALAAWRLSAGPVSLAWLVPTVEQALAPADGRYRIQVGDVVLRWAGWDRLLQVHLQRVSVLAADGTVSAELPEAGMGMSPRALLQGRVAVARIELHGLTLSAVRTAEGLELGGAAGDPSPGDENFLAAVVGDAMAGTGPLGGLRAVEVLDARVVIDDRVLGRSWHAPVADLVLRRTATGLLATASLDLELDGRRVPISLLAERDPDGTRLRASLLHAPAPLLAPLHPALTPLAALSSELALHAELTLDASGALTGGQVEATAGAGRFADPALLPEPVEFGQATLRLVGIGRDGFGIEAELRDFGGALMRMSGRVSDPARPALALTAELRGVPANALRRLWPLPVAAGGRRWVTQNIADGQVSAARFEVALRAPADWARLPVAQALEQVVVERFEGRMDFAGLTVTYRAPMPPVRNVAGTGVFATDSLTLDVSQGATGSLRVERGRIVLSNLGRAGEEISIDVNIRGPARDAMQLLESPPLQYATRLGRPPEQFGGQVAVNLRMRFPLLDRVRMAEIQTAVAATIANFQLREAGLGRDVTDGTIQLRVNPDGLELSGPIVFAGLPGQVRMERSFRDDAAFVMRTRVDARATTAQIAALGYDLGAVASGTVGVQVIHTERRRAGDVLIEANLDDAALRLDQIGYAKPAGQRAAARLDLALDAASRVREIRRFDVQAQGLDLRGGALMQPDGRTLRQVRIDSLAAGENRLRALVTFAGGAPTVELAASVLDLAPMLERIGESGQGGRLTLNATAERVLLGPGRALERVRFAGQRVPGQWLAAELQAGPLDAQGMALLAFALRSEGERQRIAFGSNDLGALLTALGATRDIRGGRMTGGGVTDPARAGRPIVGRVEVEQFRLANAPWLARALDVLMLAGIGDQMRGEGMLFARLQAPFAFADGRLELRDAHAYGVALGVTASGAIDLGRGLIGLDGTLVPAYALNNLVTNIPLLGPAIAGGRGGGLFGANYTVRGPLASPQVEVSALSALAPGFLRELVRQIESPPQR